MAEVGWASLGIIPTFDNFGRELEQGSSKHMLAAGSTGGRTFGDAAGKSAGKRFGSVFKTAAKASLIGIAALGAGAIKIGADAIDIASGIEESANKLDQVFGAAAERVTGFSAKTADALGQSDLAARNAAATFGIYGKSAGLADRQNAKFSIRMTRLASDLASFHDAEPEEVVQALGSALRGEAEPMRKFGVLLDDATLKAEAMALGLLEPVKDEAKIRAYQVKIMEGQKKYNEAVTEYGAESLEALKAEAALGTARESLRKATEGTIPTLTQQQKVLAANSAIFKQTSDAQGDFARTSDSLANQQRRMKARFEDTKAAIGKGLLPIMSDAADFVLDHGLPAFERFSTWFNDKGIPAISDFAEDVRPLVRTALPAMGDALGIARDALADAAPYARDLVEAFNDMPNWAKTAIVGGGGGLLLGRKLGLGKLAGKAGGSLVSKAAPVPVFVTNPGFGGAGGDVPGGKAGKWSKLGRIGGFAAGAAGVGFLAEPMINNDTEAIERATRGFGILGPIGPSLRQSQELLDKIKDTRVEVAGMHTDLSKRIKLEIDNRPAHRSIAAVQREVENLAFTIQSLNAPTAAGAHSRKLYGDSYGTSNVTNINIGEVRPQDDREFMRSMQRRSRVRAGGGVVFE